MIYYMDFPANLSENEYLDMYAKLSALLPDFRRQKAEAFHAVSMRVESALSYLLLCYGLSKEYPDIFRDECRFGFDNNENFTKYQLKCHSEHPSAHCYPEFAYGENGKPYLKNNEAVHFNISHCKNSIVCAIHSADIGVDIQDVRAPRPALLNKFEGLFSANAEEFTKKWSELEAVGKLIGTGITPELIRKYGAPDFATAHNITVFTQKKAATYLTTAVYGGCDYSFNIQSINVSELIT